MIHAVQAGDTLSKIARDVLGDMNRWQEVAQLNNLPQPYTIYVGQVLQLPDSLIPPVTAASSAAGSGDVTAAPAWRAWLTNPWVWGTAAAAVGLWWYFSESDTPRRRRVSRRRRR